MKRILIATWCNNNGKTNYGQVLQAFALQKYLINKENKVKVLNYINIIQAEKKSSRIKKFKKFIKENIYLTRPFDNINELDNKIKDIDILIAGSDQIWNPAILNEVYLLTFADENIRRVSYASSGIFCENDDNVSNIKKIAKELDKFYLTSVRENVSSLILQKHMKNKPEVVCDPVLLLTENEWLEVAKEIKVEEKYIFCYVFGGIRNIQAKLDYYRKSFNAQKIFVIPSNLFEERISWKRIKYLDNVGPAEFIFLIKNAEAVITDSFHGTAFSIIFKKQFVVNKRYNENSNPYTTGDRISSLMECLEMDSRKVKNVVDIENIELINYTEVSEKLEKFRKKSEEFLKKAIS